jgi:hypothetical protein
VDHAVEPIADDELLYRRVPAMWYEPTLGLSDNAFSPREDDITGLSVSRAKYKTEEEAARGFGKCYYLAVLRAGDLREMGIEVEPRPLPGDPGHSELPGLNADNRKTSETLERKNLLAGRLCLEVRGPYEQSQD